MLPGGWATLEICGTGKYVFVEERKTSKNMVHKRLDWPRLDYLRRLIRPGEDKRPLEIKSLK